MKYEVGDEIEVTKRLFRELFGERGVILKIENTSVIPQAKTLYHVKFNKTLKKDEVYSSFFSDDSIALLYGEEMILAYNKEMKLLDDPEYEGMFI